jgi:hypothetical protein
VVVFVFTGAFPLLLVLPGGLPLRTGTWCGLIGDVGAGGGSKQEGHFSHPPLAESRSNQGAERQIRWYCRPHPPQSGTSNRSMVRLHSEHSWKPLLTLSPLGPPPPPPAIPAISTPTCVYAVFGHN